MQPVAYTHVSRAGAFLITHEVDGDWSIRYEGRLLGYRYPSPQVALNQLVTGRCYWPETTALKSLALPAAIADWNRVMPAAAL